MKFEASTLRALVQDGHLDRAILYCDQLLNSRHIAGRSALIIQCLKGECLNARGRYRETIEALLPLLLVQSKIIVPESVKAWGLAVVANAFRLSLDFAQAINFGRLSLENAELLQNTSVDDVLERSNKEDWNSFVHSYRSIIGTCFYILGRAYTDIGELYTAEGFISRSVQARNYSTNPNSLAQAYFALGMLRLQQGNYRKALEDLESALRALPETPLPHPLRGKLELNIGALWAMLGYTTNAVERMGNAFSILQREENRDWAAVAATNLAFINFQRGQVPNGRKLLGTLASRTGADVFPLATINANIIELEAGALFDKDLFDFSEFHTWIQKAKNTGDRNCISQALISCGRALLFTHDYHSAKKYFSECFETSNQMGSLGDSVTSSLFLCEIACDEGRYEEAETRLLDLQAAVDRIGSRDFMAHWRETMGRVRLASGDCQSAFVFLRQAVTLWEMTGNVFRLARALARFATVPDLPGNRPHRDNALERARKIAAQLSSTPLFSLIETCANSPLRESTNSTSWDLSLRRILTARQSRELLLAEIGSILEEDFAVNRLVISENSETVYWARGENSREAAAAATQKDTLSYLPEPGYQTSIQVTDKISILFDFGEPREALPIEVIDRYLELAAPLLEAEEFRTQRQSLAIELSSHKVEPLPLPGVIYNGSSMRSVAEAIHRLNSSKITVLLTGESGTGKEVIARAVHRLSKRADMPFIPVNCAAVPEAMFESILFGHKRGAFTGAIEQSTGIFREAEGGTIFLDEVTELPQSLQPKLLRFLQEGEVQVLGEPRPRMVDARIIAATNRDIRKMVADGLFREDLYYRLNIIEIPLPPLRERKEDLPALIDYFLRSHSDSEGKSGLDLEEATLEILMCFDWPGNVRELSNEIRRLVALAPENSRIGVDLLSPKVLKRIQQRESASAHPPVDPRLRIRDMKYRAVIEALDRNNGSITHAARDLGMTRNGLSKFIAKYNIVRRVERTAHT